MIIEKELRKQDFDKINDVESWLANYKSIIVSIENLKEELRVAREYNITAATTEGGSKTNKFNSSVENSIQRAEELQNKIIFMENKISQINRALGSLSEIEREIINNFYIEGKRYFEFTHKVYKAERTCKDIKKRALNKIIVAMFGI